MGRWGSSGFKVPGSYFLHPRRSPYSVLIAIGSLLPVIHISMPGIPIILCWNFNAEQRLT